MTDSLTGGWTEGGAAFRTTLGVEGKSCLSLTYPCCMLVGTCLMVPVWVSFHGCRLCRPLQMCSVSVSGFLDYWVAYLAFCREK